MATPSSNGKIFVDIGPHIICVFCSSEFKTPVVKELGCGGSVCEKCFSGIQSELASSGQYDCLKCNIKHEQPPDGFHDNQFAIRLLRLERAEKTLSEPEKKLKIAVGKTQDLLVALESDDYKGEAEKHFHELEASVVDAVDDAFEHLKALELHYVDAIDQQRAIVLASDPPLELRKAYYKQLDHLKQARQMVSEWQSYFIDLGRISPEDKVTKALSDLDELNSRLEVACGKRLQDIANWCSVELTLKTAAAMSLQLLGRLVINKKVVFEDDNNELEDEFVSELKSFKVKREKRSPSGTSELTLRGDQVADRQAQLDVELRKLVELLQTHDNDTDQIEGAKKLLNGHLDTNPNLYRHIIGRYLKEIGELYVKNNDNLRAVAFYKLATDVHIHILKRQPRIKYSRSIIECLKFLLKNGEGHAVDEFLKTLSEFGKNPELSVQYEEIMDGIMSLIR